jgi:Flp pilus assembly protein TadD
MMLTPCPNQRTLRQVKAILLPALLCNLLCPLAAWCQSNGGGEFEAPGFRAEINVTVKDSSGSLIAVRAAVKLLRDGMPYDQGATSEGRVFFMTHRMGDFIVTVDAPGFKSAQKDVTVTVASKYDVEITLQPDSSPNFTPGTAGNPILAPKAKEALGKGIRALRDGKLQEAEKALDEAIKLAPNNPDVLYVLGVLDLKKRDWTKAQSVLEKVTQLEPNSARALAALGMALCNQQKYAEAIPPLEKSIQVNPTGDWETHWSLGESYYYSERFDDALKFSQQAQTESNGQAPQVDLLVAKSLVAVGRFEDSANVLRALIKNHSDSPDAATARRFLERLTADGKIHQQ